MMLTANALNSRLLWQIFQIFCIYFNSTVVEKPFIFLKNLTSCAKNHPTMQKMNTFIMMLKNHCCLKAEVKHHCFKAFTRFLSRVICYSDGICILNVSFFSCKFEQFYNCHQSLSATGRGGEPLGSHWFLLSPSSLKTCTVNTSTWVVGAASRIWRQWPEGERAFGWAVCPLGAVTSQALHSFILQGQIPVTEPGRQRRNGPCRLPSWGFSEFGWRSHETKRACKPEVSQRPLSTSCHLQTGRTDKWAEE